MFGSPTPTKQTCCPASSRAAATIIISDLLKAAGSVTEPPRCRGRRSCRDVGPSRPSGRPVGRTTDPKTSVAPFQEPLGDRVEDLVEGIAILTVVLCLLDE